MYTRYLEVDWQGWRVETIDLGFNQHEIMNVAFWCRQQVIKQKANLSGGVIIDLQNAEIWYPMHPRENLEEEDVAFFPALRAVA